MKIKNEGLRLKQGSEIELQSAKVACIAGLFMFGYVSFLTMSTEQNFELAWVNYLTVLTPIIMFLTLYFVYSFYIFYYIQYNLTLGNFGCIIQVMNIYLSKKIFINANYKK